MNNIIFTKPLNSIVNNLESIELSIIKKKNLSKYKMDYKLVTENFRGIDLNYLVNDDDNEKIPINFYDFNDRRHIDTEDNEFISLCIESDVVLSELRRIFKII